MEFFAGSIITLLIAAYLYDRIKIDSTSYGNKKIVYRQSRLHSTVMQNYDYHFMYRIPQKIVSQASKFLEKNSTRVVFYEQNAYWIANNTLFVADMINGQVDQNSAKVVDTMALDKVELNKLSIIVEKLTEESIGDNRNPGNEKFF